MLRIENNPDGIARGFGIGISPELGNALKGMPLTNAVR